MWSWSARQSPSVISGNLVATQSLDGIMIVGSSPVVRDNRVLGNRAAGLSVYDYQPARGQRIESRPLYGDNRIENNGMDEPVAGVYPPPPRDPS